jgi:hypothetical protein
MMKKTIILSLTLVIITSLNVFAQNDEKAAIEAVITTIFDGMRAGDSSMVASKVLRDAPMNSVYTNQEGEVVRAIGSLDRWLNAIGTPHDEIWDEQISSIDIRIDGDLASVWTPYKFFVGENFSHCGVNSIQMAKLEGEWKIIHIVDTRRRDNCIE